MWTKWHELRPAGGSMVNPLFVGDGERSLVQSEPAGTESIDMAQNGIKPKQPKRHRLAAVLEIWLTENGSNLYPTRETKEKLAFQADMSYNQVNRWFANRRRKQSKLRMNNISPTSSNTDILDQDIANFDTSPPVQTNDNEYLWNEVQNSSALQQRIGVIHSATGAAQTDSNNNRGKEETQMKNELFLPVTPEHTFVAKDMMATPPALVNHPFTFLNNPLASFFVSTQNQTALANYGQGLEAIHQHYLSLLNQKSVPTPTVGFCGPSPWFPMTGIYPSPFINEFSTRDKLDTLWSPRDTSTPSSLGSGSVPPKDSDLTELPKQKSGLCLIDAQNLTEEESIAVSVLARFALQQTA